MSFNDNVELDTSQVESGGRGGGMPGGMVIGGGGGLGVLGLILFFVLQQCTGVSVDPSAVDQSQTQSQGSTMSEDQFSRCKTGADANSDAECRVIGTVNSVNAYWKTALPEQANRQYTAAKTVLYQGSTQSACGTASNQVGPFYCPTDQKVYIDASFFNELTTRFGADSGALAQEYVVAHEYGHHIEDQLGLLDQAQRDPQGAQSGGVRIELMADCLAGMWARNAATTKSASGKTYIQPLTQEDIKSALSAAAAVGDDRIQQKTQGQVNPETWTHGSAAARQNWFAVGYKYGDLNKCNTFKVDRVE